MGGFYGYQDETGPPRGQLLASTALNVPLDTYLAAYNCPLVVRIGRPSLFYEQGTL